MASRILKRVASLLGKDRPEKEEDRVPSADDRQQSFDTVGLLQVALDGPPLHVETRHSYESSHDSKELATAGPKEEALEFFFARVPPNVTYEQLLTVLSQFGPVGHLNLFKPFAESKTSKGCGIVRFCTAASAAAAKAQLHDKYRWTSDYAPMVLERVNAKKKRSNISSDGANELIFTPKFLSVSKKGGHWQEAPNLQLHATSLSSFSSLTSELQRHTSQSSSCSTYTDGTLPHGSNGSNGSRGTLSIVSTGIADVPGFDRGCNRPLNGSFAPFTADPVLISSAGNIGNRGTGVVHAGLGAVAATVCHPDSRSRQHCAHGAGLVSMGQHELSEQQRQGEASQCPQQAAWLQHWQLAAGCMPTAGVDEPANAVGVGLTGAYLPTFRPLTPSGVPRLQPLRKPAAPCLNGNAAYPNLPPTSLAVLAAGQQDQLGAMPRMVAADALCGLAGGVALPALGLGLDEALLEPATFSLMASSPAAGESGPLPVLLPAFTTTECFSTYSNFMDGFPSSHLAQARDGASGHLPSLSVRANWAVGTAAAADCGVGFPANNASLGCALQHHVGVQSGSNLQLTTGALYRSAGGTVDGTEEFSSLQQQLLQLDGLQSAACSSGYFDLYKSTSSVDSMKADETVGVGSNIGADKLSDCSSINARLACNDRTTDTAATLARQQEQLLGLQEQQQLQRNGLPGAAHMDAVQVVPLCGAGAAAVQDLCPCPPKMGLAAQRRLGDTGAWQPQHQVLHGSSCFSDAGMLRDTSHMLGAAGLTSITAGDGGMVSAELLVPTTAVSAVGLHIPSIIAISGAAVMIAATAGQLKFRLFGMPEQVHVATNIIQLMLQKWQSEV